MVSLNATNHEQFSNQSQISLTMKHTRWYL